MTKAVLDTLYSVNETLIDAADTLEGAAGAYMRVLARETRAARASVVAMLAALERAEGFISGFEDDETQESIAETLAAIRAAIARAEGEA
jgi:hypothetical protein